MTPHDSWVNAIANNEAYKFSGVDAVFFALSNKFGFKYFKGEPWDSDQMRLQKGVWSYLCQRELNKYDLAPAVYGFCRYKDFFGFITEIYDVAYYAHAEKRITGPQYDECIKWGENWEYGKPLYGFYADDLHRKNIGIRLNADGTIKKVAIDVGYFNHEHKSFAGNICDEENIFHKEFVAISETFDMLKGLMQESISPIEDFLIEEPCNA